MIRLARVIPEREAWLYENGAALDAIRRALKQARWTEEAAAGFSELQSAAATSLKNRKSNQKAKATRAEGLFKQVAKCVRLLLENPRHPGLQKP